MPPPRRIVPGRRPAALPGGGRKKPLPSQTVAKCCDEPDIQDRDGAKICTNCFTQISEANIVSDVTFEESANGAATVQGGFIGENSRHANTINTNAFRRMGGGERNNIEDIRRKGQAELQSIYPRVPITDAQIVTQAMSIWGVAANNNFTAGRTLSEVVGACLYASCRRSPDNEVLLIDIAEVIKINVFRLGEVYKTMCKELYIGKGDLHYQHMMDIESLILKYCRRLEFGPATNQVAEDAIKIVRRMKRDWITTGRHPSGLCGACIILAARMNNFKRTVREVVYVSKIADITIAKRIDEFRRTKSAALTVNQFRTYSGRLKHQHDPPSYDEAERRARKLADKKRKREEAANKRLGSQDPIDVDDQTEAGSATGTPAPDTDGDVQQRKRARTSGPSSVIPEEPRFDADGFAIPARPAIVDPALVEVQEEADPEAAPKKRGRPKKVAPAPVQISEEELLMENELQQEIEEALDDSEVNQQRDKLLKEHEEARSKASAITQRELDAQRIQARRDASGITWHNSSVHNELELVTAEQLEEEFKDDPEVENCVLTGQAAIEKEKIWLYHNEDWLREQYEKELLKKIAAAKGANKPKGGRKKKNKMGEPLLTAAGTPAETPADATAAMLARHAGPGFSKFVDYEALGKVYGNDSRAGSRAGSVAPSQAGSPPSETTPEATSGASPPANGLASPEPTQAQEQPAVPVQEKPASVPNMPSPPPTQVQAQQPDAVEGANQGDETMQEDDEEDDAVEEEHDEDEDSRPRYPGGYDDEDDDDYGDRDYGADDYGEDGYDDAINPLGGASMGAW